MALVQIDFYSKVLSKITNVNIAFPNDVLPETILDNASYKRPMKTLYLLHGFSGSSKDWILGCHVQDLAAKYNMIIIMPSGDNSFYLDAKGTGKAYCQYIGKELVEYVTKTFSLSDKKEDTFIGGLSMGGFGAIHTGLTFTETFGKIIAFSSALVIHDIKNTNTDFENTVADYYYYSSVFGDLSQVEYSINNPEYLIGLLKEQGKKIPPIYMTCGTEDFLIQQNRDFYKFLVKEGIDVEYMESTGTHDWDFWRKSLEPSMQWALD